MRYLIAAGAALGLVLAGACDPLGGGPFDSDLPFINCAKAGEIDCDGSLVRFVDGGGASSGDGLSWATAFTDVQEGINHAYCAAKACGAEAQVWVAAGSYPVFKTTRDNTIRLRPGVALLGGFAGDETALEQRDPAANETALDGGGEVCHVVTGDDATTLDGFTVQGGRADDAYDEESEAPPSLCSVGGGMLIYGVSPTVTGCLFRDNRAGFGAGVYADQSSAVLGGCRFEDNHATVDGGGLGIHQGAPEIADSTFSGNAADNEGGGVGIANGATPRLERCVFDGNVAVHGGGMGNRAASPVIESCLFVGNEAELGAGMGNELGAAPVIAGCTFHGNAAEGGGGAVGNDGALLTVVGSVFWADTPDEISSDLSSEVQVGYSAVEGGAPLFAEVEALIDSYPLFVDPEADDFHLQSGSPCIDAADGDEAPELDIEGNPRIDDPDTENTGAGPPWADMGAFEYQPD